MHEMHPQHKRPWRDIHNVWQWGITDRDLVSKLEGLGFRMQYYKNCGRFGDLPNFEEASRALFAGDRDRFDEMVDFWPHDIRAHTHALAEAAF